MRMATDSSVRLQFAGVEELESIGRLLPDLAGPFFAERFPGKNVAEFLHWKYFTNPLGDAAVAVAMDGARVVSVVAAVPKQVRVGSEVRIAFELGDFITASDFRKRGLFSSLIEMTSAEAAKRGAAFVYVRPNPISFRLLSPGLKFIEAQKLDLRRYSVPSGVIHRKTGIPDSVLRGLGVNLIAEKLALPPLDTDVAIEPVTRFECDTDEFWASVEQKYSFTLKKDSSYLNWRYVDCPTPFVMWIARRNGRVAGYLVAFLSQGEAVGYVADLFTDPEDDGAAGTLMRTAMDKLLAKGAQTVYTWAPQSGGESASTRLLQRTCKWITPPHLHVAMRFVDEKMDAVKLPDGGWHLAMGDFDGV